MRGTNNLVSKVNVRDTFKNKKLLDKLFQQEFSSINFKELYIKHVDNKINRNLPVIAPLNIFWTFIES